MLLLAGRALARRLCRRQSGLMASISSTEDARRILWKLSRERLFDREQLEAEPSGLRLRRWAATQGDDWVSGPTGGGRVGCAIGGRWGGVGEMEEGPEHSRVHWSSWWDSGRLWRADLEDEEEDGEEGGRGGFG